MISYSVNSATSDCASGTRDQVIVDYVLYRSASGIRGRHADREDVVTRG